MKHFEGNHELARLMNDVYNSCLESFILSKNERSVICELAEKFPNNNDYINDFDMIFELEVWSSDIAGYFSRIILNGKSIKIRHESLKEMKEILLSYALDKNENIYSFVTNIKNRNKFPNLYFYIISTDYLRHLIIELLENIC